MHTAHRRPAAAAARPWPGQHLGDDRGAGFFTVAGGPDLARYPDTVGRPYPTVELSIADPGPDGVGEILVRSPTVMLGYLGLDDGPVDADGGEVAYFATPTQWVVRSHPLPTVAGEKVDKKSLAAEFGSA